MTVDGPHGEHWAAYFPFTVAQPYRARLPFYLLAVAALLAMFFIFWGKDPRGKGPSPRKR